MSMSQGQTLHERHCQPAAIAVTYNQPGVFYFISYNIFQMLRKKRSQSQAMPKGKPKVLYNHHIRVQIDTSVQKKHKKDKRQTITPNRLPISPSAQKINKKKSTKDLFFKIKKKQIQKKKKKPKVKEEQIKGFQQPLLNEDNDLDNYLKQTKSQGQYQSLKRIKKSQSVVQLNRKSQNKQLNFSGSSINSNNFKSEQKKKRGLQNFKRMAQLNKQINQKRKQLQKRQRAAMKIQSNWRAFKVRKNVQAELNRINQLLNFKIQKTIKMFEHEKQIGSQEDEIMLQTTEQIFPKIEMPALSFNSILKQEIIQMRLHFDRQIQNIQQEIKKIKAPSQSRVQPIIKIEETEQERIQRPGKLQKIQGFKMQQKYYQIQVRLDQRVKDMAEGNVSCTKEKGFDTSSKMVQLTVKELILFIYYSVQTKKIVQNLNKPHGIEPNLRLMILHGYNEQAQDLVERIEKNMLVNVINQDIVQTFIKNNPLNRQVPQSSLQYFKIHSRMVVSSFNQYLTEIRPYFKQDSPPYFWSITTPPPLYTQENLSSSLQKCADRVLSSSKLLCGVFLVQSKPMEFDGIETMSFRTELLSKKRQQRMSLLMRDYTESLDQKFYFWQDQRTDALMDLSDQIFEVLAQELVRNMQKIQSLRSIKL